MTSSTLSILGFVVVLGVLNPSGDGVVRWFTLNLFLIIGLIIAIILGMIGRLFNFSRMYLYAIMNLLGFALVGRITSAGVILTILGSFFCVIGLIVFINFLKYHPKIDLSDREKAS